MRRAYTLTIDDMHPFWNYNKAYEKASGKQNYGKSNPYKLAINAKDAASRASYIVSDKMVDYDNNYIGKGLIETVTDGGITKENYNDFNNYLVARHSLEWLDKDKHGSYKKVFDEEYMNNPDTVKEIIADFEAKNPTFAEAANALYDWQRTLMKTWLVDTGVITQEQYNTLAETYPNYVPFFREKDAATKNGIIQGFASQGDVIKEAVGSGKRMYQPIENIMYNVASYVNHATKHGVMKSAVNLYDTLENDPENNILRQYWEEVYPIGGEVSDSGAKTQYYTTQKGGDAEIEDVTQAESNSISQTLRENSEGVKDQNVITFTDNGEKRYFKIYDKGMLDVLDNVQAGKYESIMGYLGAVSRVRAALITTWNAAFSLASNPTRDFGTLILNSSDANKAKIAGEAVKAYGDIFKASDMYKNHFAKENTNEFDNPYEQYLAMGGQYSSVTTEGMNSMKEALQKIQAKAPNMAKRFFKMFPKAFNVYQTVSDAIESSPRLAEFKTTLDKGYDYHEAFYRAKDVTTNFSRGGKFSKEINAASNFFNASIQGVDKFFRQAKNNPKSFAVGVACLTAAELLSWAWNTLASDDDKDEAYDNLSNYTKNNFYPFYIGNGKFVTIPKARESAVLSTAIGASLDKYVNEQEDRFKDFFSDYVLSQFMPDGSIIGVSTINDLRANKDYMDKPIVSSAVEKLPPEQQYDDSTSYLAKWLGSVMKQSPMQIDYIISSATGAFGYRNKPYFSPSGRQNVPAMLTFGANSTFLKDSLYSTDKVNMFYDNKDEAETQANGYPSEETNYLSNRYTQAGQVLSVINAIYKAEEDSDAARSARKAYVNFAAENKDNPIGLSDEVYEKIKDLYGEDSGVIALPKIDGTISYNKQEFTFTEANQIINYQKDINKGIDEAYRELLSDVSYNAMSDADKAKAIINAKTDAVKTVKQFYVENGASNRMYDDNKTTSIIAPTKTETAEYTAKQEYEAATEERLQTIADGVARAVPDKASDYSVSALKINDIKSAKIDGVSYEISGEVESKVIETANEEHYSNIEKLMNNEVNVEDIVGFQANGKARTSTQADGTKVALTGKLYNDDGTPRFDELVTARIIYKSKEAQRNTRLKNIKMK
ncbi:MAG: hypothetical protein LIO59_07285 [Oscillospiraceae bacterium]|nr:hypothetical protein [Oscillospiraceae bacterium]